MAKKWIKGAVSNAHGQFKVKAERAGESTKEFAKEHAGSPGKLGKQARLAETLMKVSHEPKHKKKHTPHDIMKSMYGTKD